MKIIRVILPILLAAALLASLSPALCWSNGGYSADPAHPDYGTHDWIAQHALDYLPAEEKQYITDNLAAYLYGTELPDNGQQSMASETLQNTMFTIQPQAALVDNASAQRAQTEYNSALTYLKTEIRQCRKNCWHHDALHRRHSRFWARYGFISTAGEAETHHSDYENYVTIELTSYSAPSTRTCPTMAI